MEIEILHIDPCPGWREAGRLVTEALKDLDVQDVPVRYTLIATPAQATEVPFAGSPTILVDGTDLFPADTTTTDLACRIYPVDGQLAPHPSAALIRTALTERLTA